MCGRSLRGNREVSGLASGENTTGPHREDEESKPMMHEPEKSDSAVVARKLANKAGRPATEPVERRAGTEGNGGSAKHVPSSVPGKRVTSAEPRARSRSGLDEPDAMMASDGKRRIVAPDWAPI